MSILSSAPPNHHLHHLPQTKGQISEAEVSCTCGGSTCNIEPWSYTTTGVSQRASREMSSVDWNVIWISWNREFHGLGQGWGTSRYCWTLAPISMAKGQKRWELLSQVIGCPSGLGSSAGKALSHMLANFMAMGYTEGCLQLT